MNETFSFSYKSFSSAAMLDAADAGLLAAAAEAVSLAYAPYSGFEVGAALLLANGAVVKGANQENASYPAGLCAERVALSAAAVSHPGVPVRVIAIAYRNQKQPEKNSLVLSPCGICRQSLLETRNRQEEDIKIIMSSPAGNGIVVEAFTDLLPFAFSGAYLH